MTEAEWLTSSNPSAMLGFLASSYQHLSARKLRLFAMYCCRNLLYPEIQPELRHAVELAELFAEDLAPESALIDLFHSLGSILYEEIPWNLVSTAVYCLATDAPFMPLGAAYGTSDNAIGAAGLRAGTGNPLLEAALHAKWLRDIFPSPYRPKHISREWFKGNDRTAEILARGIYDDRAFERLPILADAIQEAGCENEDILNHCREPGEHVRGCWVVDLVLGKA